MTSGSGAGGSKKEFFFLRRAARHPAPPPGRGVGFMDKRPKKISAQKHMKKRISRRKRRRNEKDRETGISEGMARFFVGGECKIAGFMHVKPPRWTKEYREMEVTDLVQRIQDDIEELLARAYPTYNKEWAQRFDPNYLRRLPHAYDYEDYLRCGLNKSVAEELRRGLWERIISQDTATSRQARDEYEQLLQQFFESEPRHAASALVFIGKEVATYLEYLFIKRNALIRDVAAKYDLWPVNLGIQEKEVKGVTRSELQRVQFARDYFVELGLNSQCNFPSGHRSGAEHRISPFRLAAEELYRKMLLLKDDSFRHWSKKVAPWAKQLFALTVPMTKRNWPAWWKVAKVYLYERWDQAKEEFKPLIEHLDFKYPIEPSSKTPYESNIKSRVIDNSLKDAFIALARPDL
jgi:hypothetical protein